MCIRDRIYLDWKKSILSRDSYTCQKCGLKGYLEVHHILEISEIIKQEELKTFEEAITNQKIWDKSNAISLCNQCHKESHGKG